MKYWKSKKYKQSFIIKTNNKAFYKIMQDKTKVNKKGNSIKK